MMATVDGGLVAAIIGGGISMGGGLLAVAWRLGRQTQALYDLERRINTLEQAFGAGGRRWYEQPRREQDA